MDMTETKPALSSVSADDARDRGGKAQPMLIARGLQKHFPITGGILNRTVARIRAVDGVSFTVMKGETLGVVGESGCGKSTLARLLMHLIPPDSGELIFDGEAVAAKDGLEVRDMRRLMQMVFQDSYSRSIRACRWKIPSLMAKLSMARATKPPNRPPAR